MVMDSRVTAAAHKSGYGDPPLLDLVSADGVEQWWIRPDDRDLCAAAVNRLSGMAMMPPIRVLTEGPTDQRFIEAAFGILRPDVCDLMTFLNPRRRPRGTPPRLPEWSSSSPPRAWSIRWWHCSTTTR